MLVSSYFIRLGQDEHCQGVVVLAVYRWKFYLLDNNWLGRINRSLSFAHFPHYVKDWVFIIYSVAWHDSLILDFIRLAIACPWEFILQCHSKVLTDHPFLFKQQRCFTSYFPKSGRAVNWVFGESCPESSLMCFSFSVTSCDHSGAGYYLLVPTVCEIITVFGRSVT